MENTNIIGVKTADGAFYPILEQNYEGKKKLVLTTVRDNQKTVQIDLYQKKSEDDESKQYVGSLVIENIKGAPKGEPEVEVVIGIDSDGNLNAIASDKATGNKQRLTTSLENLSEEELFDVPDFDLDEPANNKSDVTQMREPEDNITVAEDNQDFTVGEDNQDFTVAEDSGETKETKKKGNPVLMIIFILLGLALVVGITFFIFYLISQNSDTAKPEIEDLVDQQTEQQADDTQITAIDEDKKKPDDVVQDTAIAEKEEDTSGDVTSEAEQDQTVQTDTEDQTIVEDIETTGETTEDFEYTIKWGDTLWDLSATFYRDPLKYPVIADYEKNNISDPDFILANTTLYIPEK